MYKVLYFETLGLLDRIKLIKEFYDEGSFRIVDLFKKADMDFDDYEMYCFESMYEVAHNVTCDELFYEDDEDITEDSEAYGEVWELSSDEMKEYYRLLRELKESNRITAEDYTQRKKDMENCICRYILNPQSYQYVGIDFEVIDNGISPSTDCLKVYLDFNCCFDFFCLFCGLVAVFDRYANLLNELKGILADGERVLEAA